MSDDASVNEETDDTEEIPMSARTDGKTVGSCDSDLPVVDEPDTPGKVRFALPNWKGS